MAALPISLRRELEQEYKRQQSESIARPSIPKFVHTEPSVVPNLAKGASTSKTERLVKQPQDLKTADRQTLLTNLWCGSPPKWVPLFKEFKLAGKCSWFYLRSVDGILLSAKRICPLCARVWYFSYFVESWTLTLQCSLWLPLFENVEVSVLEKTWCFRFALQNSTLCVF